MKTFNEDGSISISDLGEFETKYRVEGSLVYDFKRLVQKVELLKERIYLESDDTYYVKGEDFLRHRFDIKDLKGRQELTYKKKLSNKNNIYRKENNLRVDGNSIEGIADFCKNLGFEKNFTISKLVHIYKFSDATIPFYTVIDEAGDMAHFVEIEVDEGLLHNMVEDDAWAIIEKYEKILAPLGITAQKRLRRSLFEMYKKS